VTSIQTYVYWNKVEKTAGVIDWSAYDPLVKLYRQLGLKWVPFIVMSPWYVTPEFVRQTPGMTMYRCLEHGRDSQIPSIWSPALRGYVRHCLGKLAEHYRPMEVLESVNLGISGDYGEAIYPVIGNWPGAYHSHSGYWCGDPLATADFRRHLQALYPAGIPALNAGWKSRYADFSEIQPFLPGRAPSERAWQDFLGWYRGAMTAYADDCLRLAREFFRVCPFIFAPAATWLPSTARISSSRRAWPPSTRRECGSPTRRARSRTTSATPGWWHRPAVTTGPILGMNRPRLSHPRALSGAFSTP
jgi:hypothetical protein